MQLDVSAKGEDKELTEQLLLTHMVDLSKSIGCYKITVRCSEDRIEFFNKVGLKCETNNSNAMIFKFDSRVVNGQDLQGS